MDTSNNLTNLKTIVRRRYLDAFDKGGTSTLNLIMGDLNHLDARPDNQASLNRCISELMFTQHYDKPISNKALNYPH